MSIDIKEVEQLAIKHLKSFQIKKKEDLKFLSQICKIFGKILYAVDKQYYIADQREIYEIPGLRGESISEESEMGVSEIGSGHSFSLTNVHTTGRRKPHGQGQ